MKAVANIIAQSLLGLCYIFGWALGAAATMAAEGIADGTRAVDEYNARQLEEAIAREQE